MARGNPGYWSCLIAVPFLLVGAWLYMGQTDYPPDVGVPVMVFGAFVFLTGLYIHFVEIPGSPRLRDGESIIAKRNPQQRVAVAKIIMSVPLLAVTFYLLYFTFVPYVYPAVTLLVGLFLFTTGMYTYWSNSLTTYYLTSDRVLKEYRLFALHREELPIDKVRSVQEHKSITETLVGLGNVRVASGAGRGLTLVVRNIPSSTEFADDLRGRL